MMFQASNFKGNQFLDLVDNNNNIIKPTYIKGGLWLKVFGHLNSLCICTTRAITNHAPIGEFRLRFFLREEFKYPCNQYSIETRHYILHEYGRLHGYWNPRRDSLSHLIMFLVFNPSAFSFSNSLVYASFSFLFLFIFCFLLLSFLSFFSFCFQFSFSFPCSFVLMYIVIKVATTVCLYTPYNKLMI